MNIDFSKFNWEEIFGTVVAADGLKRAQARGLRTEIIELAIAKYSNGQLKYVGMNDKLGHDFITEDIDDEFLRIECKVGDRLFQPIALKTKNIILKNFAGNKTDTFEQKFDYILMMDTVKMQAGYATYEAAIKNCKIKDSNVNIQVDHSDITWVCSNIIPKNKPNIGKALQTLLDDLI